MMQQAAVISAGAGLLTGLVLLGLICLLREFLVRRRKEKERFLNSQSIRLKYPEPLMRVRDVRMPVQVQPLDRRSSLPLSVSVAKALAVPYAPHRFSSSECVSTDNDIDDYEGRSMGSRSSDSSPERTGKDKWTPVPKRKAKEAPAIHFGVLYSSTSACLTVNVEKITNVPIEFRKHCSTFFRVSLQSTSPDIASHPQQSQARDSLNPQFKENFVFSNIPSEEACVAILEFQLFVKKYGKLKDKHVGVVQIGLRDLDLKPDQPMQRSEKFTLIRNQKHPSGGTLSIRPEEVRAKSPSLFVSIEYKPFSNRLKVMVRKATNLPDSRGLVPPHYYVIVNLCHKDEEVSYKETRSISGRNPVWNTPFIFNIKAEDVEDHWLQLIVMRGRIYSDDCVVGHVLVGKDTTARGVEQWIETTKPYSKECAQWHPIVPL